LVGRGNKLHAPFVSVHMDVPSALCTALFFFLLNILQIISSGAVNFCGKRGILLLRIKKRQMKR
jgi:hypothetical protein